MTGRKALLTLVLAVVLGCDSYTPPIGPSPVGPTPPGPPPVEEPVSPTALPPLSTMGPSFLAGGDTFQWIGVTAFDLPRRVAEGDRSYLDWAADTGFTILRVVPASKFRTERTLDEGVAELGPFLDAAATRGLYAEVVIGVDTRLYGLTEAQFVAYAERIARVVNAKGNAVIEVANEIGHATQQDYLASVHVQRHVLSLFTVPGSAGSTHGGQAPRWDAGAFLTHHADRRLSPMVAAAAAAAIQARIAKPVVLDEHLGIGPVDIPGSRTSNARYALEQAQAARRYGLPTTLHLDAGLEAYASRLSGVEREAARLFVEEMRR